MVFSLQLLRLLEWPLLFLGLLLVGTCIRSAEARAFPENEADIKESTGCEYDGKNFTLGEDIPTPSKPCYICKCNESWDENSPNSEVCDVVECPWREYEKFYSHGCQPVYSPRACCPTNWSCPNDVTTVPEVPLTASPDGQLFPSDSSTQEPLSSSTLVRNRREHRETESSIVPVTETSPEENSTTTTAAPSSPSSSPSSAISSSSPRPAEEQNTSSFLTSTTSAPVTEMTPAPSCDKNVKCPWHQWGHYVERSCTPFYHVDGCCPAGFKCPPVEVVETYEADCMYGGEYFKLGEVVNQSSPCQTCVCGETPGAAGGASKKGIRCEQRKPCGVKIPPGCVPLFKSHDPCCPSDYYCRNELTQTEGKNAKTGTGLTCEVNGRTYVEGQLIISEDNPCMECLCDGNYTGPNDTDSCTKIDHCFMVGREEMRRGCIPIYYQGGCCPIEWHCPQRTPVPTEGNVTGMCVFDGRSYPVGSGLDIGQQCVNCTCATPPDFTCVHRKCAEPPSAKCTTLYRDGECCPHYQCKDGPSSNQTENS